MTAERHRPVTPPGPEPSTAREPAVVDSRPASSEARMGEAPVVNRSEAADEGEMMNAAEVVEADLAAIAAERDRYIDALQRLQADFENYRKRVMKQQAEQLERAAESLVQKLLDVLDTFDLALAHGEGLEQVHAKLLEVLEKEGLERIQPDGEPFDPNEHDAVAHEEGEPDAGGPAVSGVMRPGYRWKGRLLRPAMVKVRG